MEDVTREPADERSVAWSVPPGNEVYLALFDILGFKAINGKDPKLVASWLAAGLDAVKHGIKSITTPSPIRVVVYSDSILLYVEPRKSLAAGDLAGIIVAAAKLIGALAAKGVPVRGGITRGQFALGEHDGDRIFFGSGLVRAYELEQGQKWVGAIVDPDLTSPIDQEGVALATLYGAVRKFSVPWRENPSPRQFMVVDWPGHWQNAAGSLVPRLASAVPPSLDGMAKIEAATEFYDFSTKNSYGGEWKVAFDTVLATRDRTIVMKLLNGRPDPRLRSTNGRYDLRF